MPMGQQALIPPTGKASILAHYLRLVVFLHFLTAVLSFVSLQIIPGVFDLFGSLIGFLALRKKEGYAFQQVFCYTIFSAIRFITSIITAGLAYSDSDLGLSKLPTWQFWLCVVVWSVQPFVFASGASLGYLLQMELRKMLLDMEQQMAGGGPSQPAGASALFGPLGGGRGGAGTSAPRQEAASDSGSYQAPLLGGSGGVAGAAAASDSQSNFRAFAGQGHRLGGT